MTRETMAVGRRRKRRGGRGALIASGVVFLLLGASLVTVAAVLWEKEETLDVPSFILQNTDSDAIAASLKNLTSEPHTAGTEADQRQGEWIAQLWREQGMDTVNLVPYDVLLSYPDTDKENTMSVVDDAGEVLWTSQGRQPPLWPGEEHPRVFPNFNAYSAAGVVQGDVVYAYLGRDEDFEYLEEHNVSVSGCIVLIRIADQFQPNQVRAAETRGAGGVLLFLDPANVSPAGQDEDHVYPTTVYAPPQAVRVNRIMVDNGDPLTPFYPAIESAFRIPEDEADIPKIPVQPLSYEDAAYILRRMAGEDAPEEWQGGLDLTYRLGPGLQEPTHNTTLTVHTHNQRVTVYNVVATIRGAVEPDRYVLLGNHRDAWNFGGVDPSTATASLLEVTRLYGLLLQEGWRPRRTLVFCVWTAEEYGLLGSIEWIEQFATHLKSRAVAYLNVDTMFLGTYSFMAMASPLLRGTIVKATQMVPNPDPEEAAAGREYLYDTWLRRTNDTRHPERPSFLSVGFKSDISGFQHVLGVPAMDMGYMAEPGEPQLPLYHTLYETYHLARNLYDPTMEYHKALTRTWALVAFFFSNEAVIPFSVSLYGEFLMEALQDLEEEYGDLLNEVEPQLVYLREAVSIFEAATKNWTASLASLDTDDVLAVRAANDAQMMLDRAFLDPQGLPNRPHYNHVVMSPSITHKYTCQSFKGLQDLLVDLPDLPPEEQVTRWRQVKEHLAAITHFTRAAANTLTRDLW